MIRRLIAIAVLAAAAVAPGLAAPAEAHMNGTFHTHTSCVAVTGGVYCTQQVWTPSGHGELWGGGAGQQWRRIAWW